MKYGYMIKTLDKDLRGHNGFQYPKKGKVIAPDWSDNPECEGGIFGCIAGLKGFAIQNNHTMK